MVTSVAALTEEAFRALLDERGVLRRGVLEPPDRARCFAVFAQRTDAWLDVEGLKRQGERFFAARLGVSVDKHYGDVVPEVDAARVIIATADGTSSGTRLCYGRPADEADRAAA
jgi:hypothetical protein